jgi:hypothetical protein
MLGTFSDWMLNLPVVLQVLVAFAVITVIGIAPLLLWLGYAVASTGRSWQRRGRGAGP